MNRAELARSVADRVGRDLERSGVPVSRMLEVMEVEAGDPLAGMLTDPSIDTRERLALAIAGPAFQWR